MYTYIEGDTLLGHSGDSLLIHVGVVYAHAAEYRERLHEILIVLCK